MVKHARAHVISVLMAICPGLLLFSQLLWAQPPAVDVLDQQTAPLQTVLRVGVYNNPPKIFLNNNQQPDGMLWRLIDGIAEQESWQLEAVACDWNECLVMLERGELDLMPDVAISDARSQRFDFHREPALLSWSQVFERRDLGMLSMLDIDRKRVALLQSSVQYDYLVDLAMNFGISVQWVMVDSPEQAFAAVVEGEADAAVSNHFYGDLHAARLGLSKTPIIFQPIQLYFAVGSGRHAGILHRIDQYLIAWKRDPSSPYFEALSTFSVEPPLSFIPGWVIWGLIMLSLGLLGTFVFSVILRARVADRTASLLASENRLNTILNSVEAHIYIKDSQLRYQYVNKKVCELFSLPPEKIIGKTDAAFFDAETCEHLRENDLRVLRNGLRVADEESNFMAHDQQEHIFISVKLPLRNPDGSIYALCGISTDITEHKQIRNQLHQLAYFDVLTGLPNRRLILDRLDHALGGRNKTGFEGAVLFIDLDNFKTVNDTLGHDAGDQLLQQVAKRLERGLLATDTIGRLGADEFVLIVEDLAQNTVDALVRVRDVAEFLRQQFNQPFELQGLPYVCTVSIGVVMFSDANEDIENLLKGADLALAAAKLNGRNQVQFFNPAMQVVVTRRTRIEKALRAAMSNHSLLLHIQPQVDCQGHIVSMEGLLRMTDPELGVVSPGEFIPVAETSGLIIPLGEWVVESACTLLASWQKDASLSKLVLAVNVSPKQFYHEHFVKHVIDCLEKYGIPGKSLALEVTESLLIDDVDTTVQKMQVLGAKGVQFALDDFGTGYASLSYLKRLPLTQLKIDQSFVRDLLVDQNDEAIVRTIIALGNSLDLDVVAEGVETEQQAERLRELGCHFFQGYHFGRPQLASVWSNQIQSSNTAL